MKRLWILAVVLASFVVLLSIACDGAAQNTLSEPATPTATRAATPTTKATPTAARASTATSGDGRWSGDAVEMAAFLRDIAQFRTDPTFLNYCYSQAGPYADWVERLQEFADRANVQVLGETGLVPMDLWIIGLEYCQNQGEPTQVVLEIVKRMELEWLEYALNPQPAQAARPIAIPPTATTLPTRTRRPTFTPPPTTTPAPTPIPTSTPVPITVQPMIVASSDTVCGLRVDASVECWYRYRTETPQPVDGLFRHIDVGRAEGCGVTHDGTLSCWTYREHAPDGRFRKLSIGFSNTCGLLEDDGKILCWGPNGEAPAPHAGGFVDVSAGSGLACGHREDGTVVCWATATGEDRSPEGIYRQVSVGNWSYCLVTGDGNVECGNNFGGGWTNGPLGTFTQIDVADFHTCGLRSDGMAVCWFTADGTVDDSTPQETFVQVTAGSPLNCGLREDGVGVCWNHVDEVYEHGPPRQIVEFSLGITPAN